MSIIYLTFLCILEFVWKDTYLGAHEIVFLLQGFLAIIDISNNNIYLFILDLSYLFMNSLGRAWHGRHTHRHGGIEIGRHRHGRVHLVQ